MKKETHPAALYQLRKVTRLLALIIILVMTIGLFLPTTYRVERSVLIDAAHDQIYREMYQSDALTAWMYIQDGQVDSFDGVLSEGKTVGLTYTNTLEKGVLAVEDVKYQSITFNVRPKPKMNQVHNQITLQSDAGGTKVTWVIEGDLDAGLLGPYLALFANEIAGQNFEKSLSQLKELIER